MVIKLTVCHVTNQNNPRQAIFLNLHHHRPYRPLHSGILQDVDVRQCTTTSRDQCTIMLMTIVSITIVIMMRVSKKLDPWICHCQVLMIHRKLNSIFLI